MPLKLSCRLIVGFSREPAHLSLRLGQVVLKRDGDVVGSFPCEDLGMIVVDHPQTWKAVRHIERKSAGIALAAAAFSADGRTLAFTVDSRRIMARTKSSASKPDAQARDFNGNPRLRVGLRCLKSIGPSHTLLRVGTWKVLATFTPQFRKSVVCLALSRNDRWLAAATTDARVIVWDLEGVRSKLREAGLDWSLQQ